MPLCVCLPFSFLLFTHCIIFFFYSGKGKEASPKTVYTVYLEKYQAKKYCKVVDRANVVPIGWWNPLPQSKMMTASRSIHCCSMAACLFFLSLLSLLIFSTTLAHSLPLDDIGGGGGGGEGADDLLLEQENSLKSNTTSSSSSKNANLLEFLNNLPESEEMARRNLVVHCILLLAYGLLIVVSLVGNTLVCRVLLGASKRSGAGSGYPKLSGTGTSKLLIVNLAASDLLLTTVNIPTNLVRFVARDWTLGEFICTLMPFAQSVSAYCSAWTMMVIAFERYRK